MLRFAAMPMIAIDISTAERRRRRVTEMRRCVTIAINAKSEALSADLIDDAVRLSSLESRLGG